MNPGSKKSFPFKFGDSRVDCRSRNVRLVSYELEIPEAILPHRCDNLDVPVIQEGDKAIDLFQVLFWGDMAQIWSEENRGQSELFNVLPT